MVKYELGCHKDKIDERDWKIGDHLTAGAVSLPPFVDYSSKLTPIRNQGQEPCCVAFASCAMKEYQEDVVKDEDFIFSPRWIYEQIKQPQGGAYIRDAMKLLQSTGVPPEDCNPYIPQVPTKKCSQATTLALPNRIKGYARLSTIDEMKKSLSENGPFVIALNVTDGWDNPARGAVLGSGKVQGGHAILVVGYDDLSKYLKFKNSWGEEWGDQGYGYISYSDVEKTLMDAWSAVDLPDLEEDKLQVSWWMQILHPILKLLKTEI